MSETVTHHPSCPARHDSTADCTWYCGPDDQVFATPTEDPEGHLAQAPRTAQDMALDIRAHVDEAMADRLQRFQRGFQSTDLGRATRAAMLVQLQKAGLA